MTDHIKQHPYYTAMSDAIIDTPDILLNLADDEEGRDILFRKFWVNYMERMAKENRG